MAEQEQTPVFQIQRMYLKDLSLEQPNSPQILLEQQQPQVEINLGMGAEPVGEGIFEVTVTATVTTKVKDKTLFLVEVKQAGAFLMQNLAQEDLKRAIASICPGVLFPYARSMVSQLVSQGGFPQLLLPPVNFDALYLNSNAQSVGATPQVTN